MNKITIQPEKTKKSNLKVGQLWKNEQDEVHILSCTYFDQFCLICLNNGNR